MPNFIQNDTASHPLNAIRNTQSYLKMIKVCKSQRIEYVQMRMHMQRIHIIHTQNIHKGKQNEIGDKIF